MQKAKSKSAENKPAPQQVKILRSSREYSPFRVTYEDFKEGIEKFNLWFMLGKLEVRRRYRRTMIGPFWATGHISIYIICVGFIFSSVLATDRPTYIVHLATSFISWMFIYNIFQESVGTFSGISSLRQQLPFPYSMFVFQALWRNFIVHIHNYALYILVAIVYPVDVSLKLFLLIPGYILVFANLIWIVTLLGLLASRYRDFQQAVAAIIQVMVFVTPIFWSESMMSATKRLYVLTPNLLYHLTVVLRDPMLGRVPPIKSYIILVATFIIGSIVTAWVFGKVRRRIIFWIM